MVRATETVQREQERRVRSRRERSGLDSIQERTGNVTYLLVSTKPYPIPSHPLPRPHTHNLITTIPNQSHKTWTFRLLPKSTTINALVSLSLAPATLDTDFIQVKYHKDQANAKDYSHSGLGFDFKKWQADHVAPHMDAAEVKAFEGDRGAGKTAVRVHGSGGVEGGAPVKEL